MSSKISHSLFQLAERLSCQLIGDGSVLIDDVAELQTAKRCHLSFFTNAKYAKRLKTTEAGAIIVKSMPPDCAGLNFLVHDLPEVAFERAIDIFRHFPSTGFLGIHQTAVIHPTAELGENVTIGPYCVIDKEAKIGDRTHLSAHVCIGAESILGTDCHLHPHVVIREKCTIGNSAILQPGAIIGSCGFGFFHYQNEHCKQRQTGGVNIGDGVEIGALTAVDRARIGQTIIGNGTKIDNLVQLAHNVHVGAKNLIAAQTGLAGSSSTGSYVTIGGQSALVGHIKVADNITIAAKTGVSKSLTRREIYAGIPATALFKWREQLVMIKKLPGLNAEVKALRHRIQQLETLTSHQRPQMPMN